MKLTFYGGVREIGGNKILLEDKNTIFLDFGKVITSLLNILKNFKPKSSSWIKRLSCLRVITQKQGIYRKDLIYILQKQGKKDIKFLKNLLLMALFITWSFESCRLFIFSKSSNSSLCLQRNNGSFKSFFHFPT